MGGREAAHFLCLGEGKEARVTSSFSSPDREWAIASRPKAKNQERWTTGRPRRRRFEGNTELGAEEFESPNLRVRSQNHNLQLFCNS
jgi:hypothetical protein